MSWKCYMVTSQEAEKYPRQLPIGAMYYADSEEDRWYFKESHQSPDYKNNHASNRPPLFVQLPGGLFALESKRQDNDRPDAGWVVTGDPPTITVTPSINEIGIWHGWIRDGIITDDCDGRVFP